MNVFKTIRTRLLVVPAVAIFAVAVTAGLGLFGLELGDTALKRANNFSHSLLAAAHIDVIHSDLRGDAFLALLTGPTAPANIRDEVRANLARHLKKLRTALGELETLDLAPEILKSLEAVKPELEAYMSLTENLVNKALTVPITGRGEVDAYMAAYLKLEGELSDLGDDLQASGNQAILDKSRNTQRLILALACWGLLASAVCIAISWLVSRSIVRPLGRVCESMVDVGNGKLQEAIPDTNNQSELGMIARSLDGLRQRLIAAAGLADERQKQQVEQQRLTDMLRVGLNDLSAGNFTRPINTAFAPEYEVLRENFNNVVEKLSRAISMVVGSSESIRSRSIELTRAADDLAHRTETQAATLEQTAAAMDEMTASVKSSATNTKEVETIVRQARKEAEDTGAVVKGAVAAMVDIEKSSNQISQIISVIDDIAFQTNLLALNAGVEAARAGDAGRGFAVVASEVGALAQRSSMAAKEIKTLIGDSTQNVSLGVDQVGLAGQALTSIVERVAQISNLVSNIATGAVEQSTGLGEINVGVTQLDLATQQNAAMVEQTTAASQLLSQSASDLTELMSQFVVRADMRAAQEARVSNVNAPENAGIAPARVAAGGGADGAGHASAQASWSEF